MIVNDRVIIKRLLDSRNGIHLTGYLSASDSVDKPLPEQLKTILKRAEGFLDPVMAPAEKEHFLRPVHQLLHSESTLSLMSGNIGIFRTRDSFHVLRLPVDVRLSCIVASSFHVKPLLKWFQSEQKFLLLGLSESEAHLYAGSQYSFTKWDSFKYRDASLQFALNSKGARRLTPLQRIRPLITLVHDWLDQLTQDDKPRLFVAGERHLTDVFIRARHYRNIERNPVWSSFNEAQLPMILDVIRKMNRREQMLKIDKSIFSLRHSQGVSSVSDLGQIAEAAAQGSVRSLFVAEDKEIFGKLDVATGRIRVHPEDLDHEDDDLLDDLAQAVLAYGGEVVIAAPSQLPGGGAVLAVIEQNSVQSSNSNSLKSSRTLHR